MSIVNNIKIVKNNIKIALQKSKNPNKNVTLVVVTKNRDIEEITQVINAGHFILGENRVQELRDKYTKLPEKVEWHLIGHLQRNKVKYITDKVKLIHSLEKYSLAEEINKKMEPLKKAMDCLIQVNIAEEDTKFGLKKEEVFSFIEEVSQFKWVKIKGLMAMAPYVENPEEVRPYFREMFNKFTKLKEANLPNVEMEYLSMGMTNDYQVAIEEGANIIRVGSGIFESVE